MNERRKREWKLEGSPTKSSDVPHCQWAARLRRCEFFVRAPKGIGTAIPVCRQFQLAVSDDAGAYFRELIGGFPVKVPPVLAEVLRGQIRELILDAHGHLFRFSANGARTVLECFTGRPLTKSEDHREWILGWLDDVLPGLDDGGVASLWCLVRSEWEQARQGCWGWREYHLLVGESLVAYEDVEWSSFWREKEV